jgi:kynurenine formamidase
VPTLIDLSHEIEGGTITYPGLPGPMICDYLSREASKSQYAEGTSFHIGRIDMVANTGTYLDAPFHRYEDGMDLAELPLESIVDLDGVVLDARGIQAIDATLLADLHVTGKAVLIRTGWSAHWGTPTYLEGHPYLTADAAESLRDRAAVLVGIDSLNIDDTGSGARPVHSILLASDIPIVEHLCHLDRLPLDATQKFRFHAAPVKVRAFGTFPVRAYAVLDY